MKKTVTISSILVILILPLSLPLAHADRCILPTADVDVYGPGQKAIIAWNGETELLILSTDLYASADTKVLEVLPLPSEPSVEKGRFESFEVVQRLMMEKMPRVAVPSYKGGLEIVFHEKIGAHDITVVKAISIKELSEFILDYTRKMGIAQLDIGESAAEIFSDYLTRGFDYWVFDLVDLYSTARSIEPIVYRFQSPSLYYPLKVSATAKGPTEIILYLIAPQPIGEDSIPSKMRVARYLPSDQIIRFEVSHDELAAVDEDISSLFPMTLSYPPLPAAWFTAIKYEGDSSELDFDLEIYPSNGIPPHPPCRSIEVSTDKTQYDFGETVEIVVDYVHLLPDCAEVQVVHFHQIRLEVLDSAGETIQMWQWETKGDLYRTVAWRSERTGDYTMRASSWWNGERSEVEDQTAITISSTSPPPPYVVSMGSEVRWLLYGVIIAVVCIFIGATLTYLLLRKRQ